jgi:hypothetical protein
MRNLWILPCLLFSSACAFTDVRGHADVNNRSSNKIEVYADGKLAGTAGPNSVERLVFDVPVSSYDNGTEPTDRSVSITIVVHDLTLDLQSQSASCTAGAKVFTHIEYSTYGTGTHTYSQISCSASYDRIPRDTLRAAQP